MVRDMASRKDGRNFFSPWHIAVSNALMHLRILPVDGKIYGRCEIHTSRSSHRQVHREHLIANTLGSSTSSSRINKIFLSSMDSWGSRCLRYDSYVRFEGGHNSLVDDTEICRVEAVYHKAEELEEWSVHNCRRCPRRWPLGRCCMDLCDTSLGRYGCHI